MHEPMRQWLVQTTDRTYTCRTGWLLRRLWTLNWKSRNVRDMGRKVIYNASRIADTKCMQWNLQRIVGRLCSELPTLLSTAYLYPHMCCSCTSDSSSKQAIRDENTNVRDIFEGKEFIATPLNDKKYMEGTYKRKVTTLYSSVGMDAERTTLCGCLGLGEGIKGARKHVAEKGKRSVESSTKSARWRKRDWERMKKGYHCVVCKGLGNCAQSGDKRQ